MTKFCLNCGQETDEKDKKCLNCGKIIKSNKNSNVKNNYSNKAKVETSVVGKSRILSGITAIFFGYLGVHNLYLGYTSKGIAQLLITLLTFGRLSIISTIWGLIDGIMIFTRKINTDGYGNPLSI